MKGEFSKYTESDRSKSKKHELGKCKSPVYYLYLACTAVTSWTLTQEVMDSNNHNFF